MIQKNGKNDPKAVGALIDALESDNTRSAKRIVARLDIDEVMQDGETFLTYFAQQDNADALRFLVEQKAGLEVRNADGHTPLIVAHENNSSDAIDFLLKAGADPLAAAPDGRRVEDIFDYEQSEEIAKAARRARENNPAAVTYFTQISNDQIMQETFLFDRQERLTFIRDTDKRLETSYRDAFEDIPLSALKRAFNEHARRGGQMQLDGIGKERLVKSILQRKPE